MKSKEPTLKQIANERAKILNSLKCLKDNSVIACNITYQDFSPSKITTVDLYSRKTKKRITIRTNVTFKKEEFIKDKNSYILEKIKDIIKK